MIKAPAEVYRMQRTLSLPRPGATVKHVLAFYEKLFPGSTGQIFSQLTVDNRPYGGG
jgi:hypothetical protein